MVEYSRDGLKGTVRPQAKYRHTASVVMKQLESVDFHRKGCVLDVMELTLVQIFREKYPSKTPDEATLLLSTSSFYQIFPKQGTVFTNKQEKAHKFIYCNILSPFILMIQTEYPTILNILFARTGRIDELEKRIETLEQRLDALDK